jgi:hypothetical protein
VCLSASLPSPYLELVPTGPGEPRRFAGDGLVYTGARWLPDGKRIVIAAREPGRRTSLFLHELGSQRPRRLTPEGVGAWVVSPDGTLVAARGPDRAVRLYPIDGGMPRDVEGLTGQEVPVGWIVGGLLVMRPDDPAAPRGEIYRIDSRTGLPEPWRNILPRDGAGIMGQLSFHTTPDGRSQVYTWHRALSDLYVTDGLA